VLVRVCIDGIPLFLVLLALHRLEISNWNTSTLPLLSAKRCRVVAIFYLPIQNSSTLTFIERVENGKSLIRKYRRQVSKANQSRSAGSSHHSSSWNPLCYTL